MDAENKQVSDTQRVIADKTSDTNQDRTFRVSFNLKSMKYNSKKLLSGDCRRSGLSLPQRENSRLILHLLWIRLISLAEEGELRMSEDIDSGSSREIIKDKLRQNFDGKIVRKDLTKKIKEGANVPVMS